MKITLEGKRGITLVALVVTIIVLIILAGISISLILGNNGIITRAADAKQNYQRAAEEEKNGLNELIDEIEEKIGNSNHTVTVEIGYYEIGTQVTIVEPEGTTWQDIINNSDKYGHHYEDPNQMDFYVNGGYAYWCGKQLKGDKPSDRLVDGSQYFFSVAECVYPDSEILNNLNGKVTLAKDVKIDDKIAYFNFETDEIEIGRVSKVFVHKKSTNFVRYTFNDGSYLEATDYHPIYTSNGWKSYTNRNGYKNPLEGDYVKTEKGWKQLIKIEEYMGEEDCYDFAITSENGEKIDNYFANGTLVQSSY